ncbi:unnamed protein product [Lepeophtheirus salmonis]|uniref:(salmon louse) hypothetical protein n=1 Tax=Lepeophtheirus salmonis TaxID=72036 RepID=A0A7R8H055_LEPSM|nr:unnamed protein product [Lepeophtheirus salmonis]CAF2779385.1 unnamed protein product [Lepeophtheirus salmonis]
MELKSIPKSGKSKILNVENVKEIEEANPLKFFYSPANNMGIAKLKKNSYYGLRRGSLMMQTSWIIRFEDILRPKLHNPNIETLIILDVEKGKDPLKSLHYHACNEHWGCKIHKTHLKC